MNQVYTNRDYVDVPPAIVRIEQSKENKNRKNLESFKEALVLGAKTPYFILPTIIYRISRPKVESIVGNHSLPPMNLGEKIGMPAGFLVCMAQCAFYGSIAYENSSYIGIPILGNLLVTGYLFATRQFKIARSLESRLQ